MLHIACLAPEESSIACLLQSTAASLCSCTSCTCPKLVLLLQNPDDMYAELLEQLDVVEGQLPLAAVSHIKPKDRGMEGDKDKEKQQERERQKEREKAQAAKAQLAARGGL